MRTLRTPLLILVLLSFSGVALAGNQGTTLTLSASADSTQTQTDTYSWVLQKTLKPNQTKYIIKPGQTVDVDYLITATRSPPSTSYTNTPVTGTVTITNTGTQPTIGLWVTVRLENSTDNGSTWSPFAGPQVITIPAEVANNTSQPYSYTFTSALDPTHQYRAVTEVSIDNYAGSEGTSYTMTSQQNVSVTRPLINVDMNATLSDSLTCPTGFLCTPPWPTQSLTGSYGPVTFTVPMKNNTAACGQTLSALNTATLSAATRPSSPSPAPSPLPLTASATATIYTGTCRPNL